MKSEKETKPDVLRDRCIMKMMRKVLELADRGENVEVRKAPGGKGYKVSTMDKHEVDIFAE